MNNANNPKKNTSGEKNAKSFPEKNFSTPINNPPKNSDTNGPQRIELPSGVYGVYMGETGKDRLAPGRRVQRTPSENSQNPSQGNELNNYRPNPKGNNGNPQVRIPHSSSGNPSAAENGRNQKQLRYALSDAERQEIERRRAAARTKRRVAADGRINKKSKKKSPVPTLKEGLVKYISYYFKQAVDRIYMTWMGITVDLDTIIKSLIIGGMILLFAILQTTVFSRFAPFGATPDLMLALVIAIGTTEGERWGGATGLAAAFLIEAMGGTGITLLPLLYMPVGYTVGVLCTEYLRDSIVIRLIYTFGAGILRAVITAVYVNISFDKVDAGLLFSSILIPEYFSTALMAFLPHVTEWFALKAFHKSREDRISS